MKITRIEVEGFLSYANYQDIVVGDMSLVAIMGVNGAGKSSLFQSITWCLFGEIRHSNDKTSIINDWRDAAAVTIEIRDSHAIPWRITRKLTRSGTTKLEIIKWEDEQEDWIIQSNHRASESQGLIYEVIGFDASAFYSLSFIDGSSGSSFIRAKSDDRRSILMSLLPTMERWTTLGYYTKQAASDARRELSNKRTQLEVVAENEESTQSQIDDLQIAVDGLRTDAKIKKEISNNEDLIRSLEEQLDEGSSGRRASSEKLDSIRSKRDAANSRIENQINECKSQIATVSSLEKRYDSTDSTYVSIRKKVRELEDEADELADEIEKYNPEDLKKQKSNEDEIKRLRDEIAEARSNKKSSERNIVELNEREELLDDDAAVCFVCQADLSPEKRDDLVHDIHDHLKESKNRISDSVEILEGHARRIQRLESENSELWSKVNERDSKLAKLENTIESAKRERKSLKSTLEEIDDELETLDSLETLEKKRDKLREQILPVSEDEIDLENKISEMDSGSTASKEISNIKQEIQKLNRELEHAQDSRSRLKTFKEVVKKHSKDLASVSKEIEQLDINADDYEYISKACSPRGLPNILLSDILAQLQNIQNDFLSKLPGAEPMSIEYRQTKENKTNANIKDVLDIYVHMPNGSVRPIESCSSGERIRLTLTNQLAMIHFFNEQNGDMIRNIFLDESLGVVDKEVVPVLLGTLQGAVSSNIIDTVMIISHEQSVLDALPERIHIEQIKNEDSVVTSKLNVYK